MGSKLCRHSIDVADLDVAAWVAQAFRTGDLDDPA
jgi:hypothetical protein